MKRYPGRDGGQRLWYKPEEIEEIMEHELAKANLMPTTTDPSVDIEAFLERHLKVRCDQYAPLPPEILGLTQFRAGQKPWVRINQDLTQTARRRGPARLDRRPLAGDPCPRSIARDPSCLPLRVRRQPGHPFRHR